MDTETTKTTTYTVRPLGCCAWEEGLRSLYAAAWSLQAAHDRGLGGVRVIRDADLEDVTEEAERAWAERHYPDLLSEDE